MLSGPQALEFFHLLRTALSSSSLKGRQANCLQRLAMRVVITDMR